MRNNNPDILMKPGDLAKEAGILTSRISYYTSLKLLTVGEYTDGGQKLYWKNETSLQLKKIDTLVRRGLHLDQIREKIGKDKKEKNILVIDDEPSVGELIVDLMQDHARVHVHVVHDGFAAGLKLKEYFPDLIILDLNLPGVDGFEVCKKIKEDELQSDTRILAVTGYDSEENYKRIKEQGADDYLAKPFETGELRKKIMKMLKRKRR